MKTTFAFCTCLLVVSQLAHADYDSCVSSCQEKQSRRSARCYDATDRAVSEATAKGIGSSIGSILALRGNKDRNSINSITQQNNAVNSDAMRQIESASRGREACREAAEEFGEACVQACESQR